MGERLDEGVELDQVAFVASGPQAEVPSLPWKLQQLEAAWLMMVLEFWKQLTEVLPKNS